MRYPKFRRRHTRWEETQKTIELHFDNGTFVSISKYGPPGYKPYSLFIRGTFGRHSYLQSYDNLGEALTACENLTYNETEFMRHTVYGNIDGKLRRKIPPNKIKARGEAKLTIAEKLRHRGLLVRVDVTEPIYRATLAGCNLISLNNEFIAKFACDEPTYY